MIRGDYPSGASSALHRLSPGLMRDPEGRGIAWGGVGGAL